MNNQERILDISWSTIFKLGVAGLSFYVLFLTRDILVWVLFGIILSILVNPLIDILARFRVPRPVGVMSVYLCIFGLLSFMLWGMAPFFVGEIQRFSQVLPQYFETISPALRGLGIAAFSDTQTLLDSVAGSAERIAANALNALFFIFGGIFSTIFVFSIAVFLSLEHKAIEQGIVLMFPKKYEVFALKLWESSRQKVSGWFASRLLASLFVGVATAVALLLFNVQYPFSLGLLSFVTNFVPIIGPLIAGVLVAGVVAMDSLLKAGFVMLAFFLIQQVEGNILTPLLSKKFLGVPSVLVLISLAAGGELWGIMGAIMAVPLAGILFEFLRDFLAKRKEDAASDA
ncbi:MAG: AI-2E family transporter [Candidatus Wildermuthbacteria bacterium]|nr:AI-2E family transporter [Candidatus Wildermuthbacteria bacterium]